jgi:hypothetical protein
MFIDLYPQFSPIIFDGVSMRNKGMIAPNVIKAMLWKRARRIAGVTRRRLRLRVWDVASHFHLHKLWHNHTVSSGCHISLGVR